VLRYVALGAALHPTSLAASCFRVDHHRLARLPTVYPIVAARPPSKPGVACGRHPTTIGLLLRAKIISDSNGFRGLDFLACVNYPAKTYLTDFARIKLSLSGANHEIR
jgi:hypothetical protein